MRQVPPVTREWPAVEDDASRAPSHATMRAPLLAWPLATLLGLRGKGWDDPLAILIVAVLLAMFVFYLIALSKVQRILEQRGESLFYPWRVLEPKKKARRIDGILSTSIRRLKSGEDEEDVLATLRLHLEGRLRGEAGRHYERAVEGLRDAAGRDWVFDKDRRERSLDEAERELWMTRAENLNEMLR